MFLWSAAGPDEIHWPFSFGYRRSLGSSEPPAEALSNFNRKETKGSDPMTDSVTELYDEVLSDEVPDAALEIAGSKMRDGAAASVTLAFCSGLDTCPSSPQK
jgi:hypothetical protein